MARLKIYTDEDVDVAVTKSLRLRGIHIFSTLERKNLGCTDLQQLEYAASQKAVLSTHNISDFAKIHYDYIASGNHHYGIILAKQSSVGTITKSVLGLASNLSEKEMMDRLEYLSNWPLK